MDRFFEFMGDAYLVAHNLPFDLKFVEYYYEESIENEYLDTLLMARQLHGFRSNKLGFVADKLGVDLDNAHRAIHDARATARILSELTHRISDPGDYRGCEVPEEIRRRDPTLEKL
ncbi:MAG: PolC-type DNA polymerase III, partial [bacterium]